MVWPLFIFGICCKIWRILVKSKGLHTLLNMIHLSLLEPKDLSSHIFSHGGLELLDASWIRHTHTHTHTHAHPITVIWVFLKDPNSLPNWSIRARSFWTSGILETSICIFAKGSFFFGGFLCRASQPSLLCRIKSCDSCAIERLAVETISRTNSFASECAGQTALDGLPTIWIKCPFNPFCLALGSLSFVPLGLGCNLLFFLEGSIQFGSENGRRQLPAVFGDDAYLRWSSCSATHDGSGIIYLTCIKKLDTIERDYHFT
jgi:hypothetical protein